MSEEIFREALIEDADSIAQLAHELNRYHGSSTTISAEQLRRDWDRFDAFVVDIDGKVEAYLSGFEGYNLHFAVAIFEVQNMCVSPPFRRRGLGRLLINEVIRVKTANGIRRFRLNVREDNAGARAFYRSIGFVERPVEYVPCAFTVPE